MSLTVGAEFAGYGGAELGLSQVLDLEPLWFVEFDEAPSRVLAHHWPDAPNYGDITAVDWSEVERPNIITGGSPCQDLSQAGARKGMTDGTRSNLWVSMRESIAVLRPDLFVWENVRGAFSAEADSALEPCSGCLGGGGDEPSLRALGRVLGDVSDLGYDAWWYGLPASACGAAHPRFRVFVFGVPADSALNTWRLLNGNLRSPGDAYRAGREKLGRPVAVRPEHAAAERSSVAAGLTLLPTPVADNSRGLPSSGTDYASLANVAVSLLPTPRAQARDSIYAREDHHNNLEEILGYIIEGRHDEIAREPVSYCPVCGEPIDYCLGHGPIADPDSLALLPTPAVNDMGEGKTVEWWDEWAPRQKSSTGRKAVHGKSLAIEAQRLLPTPVVTDHRAGGAPEGNKYRGTPLTDATVRQPDRWGQYAAAIARAEHVFGRPAPDPTEAGANGNPRLSPAFVEWLMGLPEGHVTDPAIWSGWTDKKGKPRTASAIRNAQLKMCGNGIVPAQIAAAFRLFWEDFTAHMTEAVAS